MLYLDFIIIHSLVIVILMMTDDDDDICYYVQNDSDVIPCSGSVLYQKIHQAILKSPFPAPCIFKDKKKIHPPSLASVRMVRGKVALPV